MGSFNKALRLESNEMKGIAITGASQRAYRDGPRGWSAMYVCHKCGEGFAFCDGGLNTEEEARSQSLTAFDRQRRRFCYRCGYKLTDNSEVPESAYIAQLNLQIDNLEARNKRLFEEIRRLRDGHRAYAKQYASLRIKRERKRKSHESRIRRRQRARPARQARHV